MSLQATNFISLSNHPFSRRGSFFTFFNSTNGQDQFGKTQLFIGSLRGTGPYRQIRAELVKDGAALPTVISSTESEVILQSLHGSCRFCIGERNFVRIKGTDGLTLRLSPTVSPRGGVATDLMDGCWQFDFNGAQAVLLPFAGKLKPFQAFGGPLFGTVGLRFDIEPDENGVVDVGIEEFTADPEHRPLADYPSYEDCVKDFQAEFDAFAEELCPSLPAEWEPMRRKALWVIWSLIVDPDGESNFKRTMIKMLHGTFEHVSGWQQAMHAIAYADRPRFAWDILASLFVYQDKNGRVADIITDTGCMKAAMKPPIQGLALNWLMDHSDLSVIPPEEKQYLYNDLRRWTDFFFRFRDLDHDGIWENRGNMETGWEDTAYFKMGFPIASPDMNAYLALALEATARFGRMIGAPEEQCAADERRAKELVARIVEKFWDGERWFAFNAKTGERSDTPTLSLYCVLLLGKRLPQEIIDKSITSLFEEGKFLTPYGLATEALDSPWFSHGFARGSIIPPAELLMCLALEACGRPELAKDVARRYMNTLKNTGLFHTHNALNGEPERSMVALDEKFLFWSAWPSAVYIFMAKRYGEEG